MDFKGFLNNLDFVEPSPSLKGKTSKPQVPHKGKSKVELVNEGKQPVRGSTSNSVNNSTRQHRSSMGYDPLSQMSSSFLTEDSTVDAASEKDLGNEYFKQKKFNEAIDCYSRSIGLSPTAVAYANRAMAYLKIKRFQEAEDDCSEALNLDDRYIKAYSRRATARKELRKLRDSIEDVEFALRLEPQNEDLKKQRAEVKSLLEKAVLAKAAGTTKKPPQGQGVKEVVSKVDGQDKNTRAPSVPDEGNKKAVSDVRPVSEQVSMKDSYVSGDTVAKNKNLENKIRPQVNGLDKAALNSSVMKNKKASKELDVSVHELASQAASRAMAEAAKNIMTPTTAYQFEVSWKGFSGDRSLQSRLLKVTPPVELPKIFKNALTAPLLMDIIKCLATVFTEETELVVKYLDNLNKVPRFSMIILCLPSADKTDLQMFWKNVFLGEATPMEFAELLSELHPRYCPQ